MKYVLLSIFTLMAHFSFGQVEKSENRIVADKFIEKYNNDDFNGIFSMFSDVLQHTLPLDKMTDLLIETKVQSGRVTNQDLIENEMGVFVSYKTVFENNTLVLNFSIDDNSKINGFYIEPFIEGFSFKEAINNLAYKEGKITKAQTEIIFDNAKVFPDQTQMAFAIIKNGKVNYYGIIKENNTIYQTHNQERIFEIGSISKVFTATLLSDLVLKGKVELNDNTNKK
ncbi:DUF3887 domain-containing protein [Flammeovirga aprica]|uniref:Beta-lactamase n=1 Tax=Flammeovirga aprica JL-4 TaxID=694437 RepID=A0A7X9P378_9BACT|nr:DUF3887 domain-containing protein [Flammeovirga aprica]NME68590.1 DUF3887 domain-containing protein [Flammeovirga aprica JL-4]